MKHFKRFLNGCYHLRWWLFGYAAWLGFVVASGEFEYGIHVVAFVVLCALVWFIYKLGEMYDSGRG